MLRQSQNLLGIGFILALIIVDGFILVEEKGDPDSMVWLDGGSFTMGSDHGLPDEAPARPVSVSGFWIDKYEVTNAQYEAFVTATDYV
ncbi:MAG: SUMF1/EgtB/PvdO family nonheme iron enzyme, partial [Pseudomonadota bacterium]|nr:SUMF1/EgtB/PvdO family nonheme iron enzyme [Pseudomonadota bacterium]